MEKISNIDLYKAKEKCLELKKKNKRLILKGNNHILLSTTLFEENTNTIDFINRTRYDFYWNSENISYLDALVMYLHEKYRVHGMIDYVDIIRDYGDVRRKIFIEKYYSDTAVKEYISKENIMAFISLRVGETILNDKASIHENISSFSFMGLTGISTHLAEKLDRAGIKNHMTFGGGPSAKEYKEEGYSFTDDIILYYDFTKLDTVKNKDLTRDEVWPRTIQIGIAKEEDTSVIKEIGSLLPEYFAWIEQELTAKGEYQAMSPMQPKEYKKGKR